MKRNTVRLTESQLHRVIKESVGKVINESGYINYDEWNHERRKAINAVHDYVYGFLLKTGQKKFGKIDREMIKLLNDYKNDLYGDEIEGGETNHDYSGYGSFA